MLMGRRHERYTGLRRRTNSRANVHAVRINWNGMNFCARNNECLIGESVTGILDPYLVFLSEQNSNGYADCLLCARSHNDLLGFALNGPRRPQIFANCRPQFDQTAWVGISEMNWIDRD